MKNNALSFGSDMPVIQTKRLTLRKMLVSDAEDMYEYASRPEVTKYLLWSPHESPRSTRSYLRYLSSQYAKNNFFDWALVLKETGKMIGTCGFSRIDAENRVCEIGYVLNNEYWGQGLAPEAVLAVCEFALETLYMNRIELRIMEDNKRSRAVAEKCGFVFEGTLRSYLYVKEKYRNICMYSRLCTDKTGTN